MLPQRDQNSRDYVLRLVGDFFMGEPQDVDIMIGGQNMASIDANASGIISIPFTSSKVFDVVEVKVKLTNAARLSPKAMVRSADEPTLTYFLKSADLQPA